VLITGASSGIGRATAERLAAAGARLSLVDVEAERLASVGSELRARGAEVETFPVDVTDRAALADCARAVERDGALDLLVNNAGVLVVGQLDETSEEDWARVLSVNLGGVVECCRLFAPAMRRRGAGHIVNVASAAGLGGFAPLLAYSTTKFAVVGFSQALRGELRPDGVGVSVVCPGLVNTGLVDDPRLGTETNRRLRALLDERGMPPERVARAILEAAERDLAVVPVGVEARLLHLLQRFTPAGAGRLLHWAARSRA
jgi:short-subunit dehydrogenase